MAETNLLSGKTAIVGIGATEFSKDSGRTELQLACESVRTALDDCGLSPSDVDGLVTFTMDNNPEIEVARSVGIGALSYFSRVPHGGGACCGTIHQAAMAVATGAAEVVVAYRAFNERSGRRYGIGVQDRSVEPTTENAQYQWYTPFGLLTPASWVAMYAQRYMYEYGATTEDFGRIAVVDRKHAATNPAAFFYGKPITLEEHAASRWIVEPLRLFDCCQESDGGQALIVTSAERARDLKQKPAIINAVGQGAEADQESMTSFYRPEIACLPEMELVGRQLWNSSGLTPDDIQTAVIYDAFSFFVMVAIEAHGFCGAGEAKDFIRDGNIEMGGGLPVNTHGGQLGEAYIHGMNGIAEAVRQVRGTAVNQVPNVEHVLATAGTGVPTSSVIVGVDR